MFTFFHQPGQESGASKAGTAGATHSKQFLEINGELFELYDKGLIREAGCIDCESKVVSEHVGPIPQEDEKLLSFRNVLHGIPDWHPVQKHPWLNSTKVPEPVKSTSSEPTAEAKKEAEPAEKSSQ